MPENILPFELKDPQRPVDSARLSPQLWVATALNSLLMPSMHVSEK
jgi:hypothetical protein